MPSLRKNKIEVGRNCSNEPVARLVRV